ncbi:MAG: family 10 glycosylhydrolase [Bacteroidota bacterium]
MNKRDFLKQLSLAGLSLGLPSVLFQACSTPATPPSLKNWLWARPKSDWSLNDWKRQLAKAKQHGISAILLEVYNGTNTFYEGGQLPMKTNLLEQLLPICHSTGLELHAWMWTMPCNAPAIIEQHPDWYAVNGLGQPAHTHPAYVGYYKFLCPCHPEVQAFVQGNVRSLARIAELDGIHLDYVRLPDVILAEGLQPNYNIVQDREYPEYDYSYSTNCRAQFKAQTGIDPLEDLEDPSANQQWRQFRYDSISKLVNNFLVPEAKKANKMITAAVFPNWESVRQEWHTWNLDAFLPMLYNNFYNREVDFIKEHTQKALARMATPKPVYSGLYLPELSPEQMKAGAQMGLEGGASGLAFFEIGSMTDAHWEELPHNLHIPL